MKNYNYPIIIGMRDSNGFSDKYVDIGIINGQQDVYDFILGIC